MELVMTSTELSRQEIEDLQQGLWLG